MFGFELKRDKCPFIVQEVFGGISLRHSEEN